MSRRPRASGMLKRLWLLPSRLVEAIDPAALLVSAGLLLIGAVVVARLLWPILLAVVLLRLLFS